MGMMILDLDYFPIGAIAHGGMDESIKKRMGERTEFNAVIVGKVFKNKEGGFYFVADSIAEMIEDEECNS